MLRWGSAIPISACTASTASRPTASMTRSVAVLSLTSIMCPASSSSGTRSPDFTDSVRIEVCTRVSSRTSIGVLHDSNPICTASAAAPST